MLWFASPLLAQASILKTDGVAVESYAVDPSQVAYLAAIRIRVGRREALARRAALWLCAESEDAAISTSVLKLIAAHRLSIM